MNVLDLLNECGLDDTLIRQNGYWMSALDLLD